jgi:hypothetical protein
MAYILLYPATSGSVNRLNEGHEFEQRLARSRGKSEVVDTIETDEERTEILEIEQGYVTTNSGIMMEFVDECEIDLPIMDVAKKPTRQAYRVTTEAFESLPLYILSQVEQQEYVRIQADYDPETKEFSNVSLGWNADEISEWDRLMEEIDQRDAVAPVIDYLVSKHGSDKWTPEAIADVRDVAPQTVRQNIRQIRTADEDADAE